MRLMPRSLFGRLLATAGLALLVALVFAGFTIAHVLERFVMHGLDERLDAQITVVERAVRPDGTLDRVRLIDVPPFDVPGSGWAWEVRGPKGVLRSGSLPGDDIAVPPAPPVPLEMPWRDRAGPRPFDTGRGRHGSHGRALVIQTPDGNVDVLATGPRATVTQPLRAAMLPLLLSLLLLGMWLAAAILVQLRFGLRPLGRLQAMLAEVREGKRTHVDAEEPTELVPLIAELNGLIDASGKALTQARGHVANLAHGLKTPLAALRVELTEPGRDPDGRLVAQVERIDRHIRHHLGRARAASPAGAGRARTVLLPRMTDIVDALAHIHAERPVSAQLAIAPDVAVMCDPQDVEEMIGNLIDNAWRWATARIDVSAERRDTMIRIVIVDDGPGLTGADLDLVVKPGARLDERGDGHGFGLSITRELAELYGGNLTLGRGREGGLAATLDLPAG